MSQFITLLIKKGITFERLRNLIKNNYFQLRLADISFFQEKSLADKMDCYIIEWQEDKFGFCTEETNLDLLLEKHLFTKMGIHKEWEQYRHNLENEKRDDRMEKQFNLERFLSEILQQHLDEKVGLFLHWYESLFDKENIEIKKEIVCACEGGKAKLPNSIEKDVLYWFQKTE